MRLAQNLETYLARYNAKDSLAKESKVYEILLCLCMVTLNLANVFAKKLITVGGMHIVLSGLIFPFTFFFLIIINEVYGHQKCGRSIIALLISQLIFLLIVWQLSLVSSPHLTATSDSISQGLHHAFGAYGQVILGSMSAVALSYYFFSVVNSKLKVMLCRHNIVVRFLISVGLAKAILVLVAYTMNLWGVVPLPQLIQICFNTWLIKMVLAIGIISLSIPIVSWISKVEELNTYDINASYNPLALFSDTSRGRNLFNTIQEAS